MTAKLYSLAHSHPAVAARMMLEHKGVDHEVRQILPGLHPPVVRAAGFPDRTVPALRLGERRVQGTLRISRALDELAPEPPLFPADPVARRAVEDAERFGHDELQPLARRVFRWAALRSADVREWMAREVAGMPLPRVAAFAYRPVVAYFARIVDADDATVREDLRRLPALLDRVDELVDAGTIGAAPPNAADFQLLASVRLLAVHADLEPVVAGRPCARAAAELVGGYPGPVPAALPAAWLPSTRPTEGGQAR